VSILISVTDKTRADPQERAGWVLRKPFEGGAGTVPLHRRRERSLKPSRLRIAGAEPACFRCTQPDRQHVLLSRFGDTSKKNQKKKVLPPHFKFEFKTLFMIFILIVRAIDP
jgi:hypothetical protein